MPVIEACFSQMRTFTVTVSILFMTPTTEYVVAVTTLWHQKPAHEMQMPTKQLRPSHVRPVDVSAANEWLRRLLPSSPAMAATKRAGSTEKVFVYRTGARRNGR